MPTKKTGPSKTKSTSAQRWKYLGTDEKGQKMYEGVNVTYPALKMKKKKADTSYKSTRSKKGRPK